MSRAEDGDKENEILKCEICGFSNPNENKFCHNCGERLPVRRAKPESRAQNSEENSRRINYPERTKQAETIGKSNKFADNRRLKRALRERQMEIKRSRVLNGIMIAMVIAIMVNAIYIMIKSNTLSMPAQQQINTEQQ